MSWVSVDELLRVEWTGEKYGNKSMIARLYIQKRLVKKKGIAARRGIMYICIARNVFMVHQAKSVRCIDYKT